MYGGNSAQMVAHFLDFRQVCHPVAESTPLRLQKLRYARLHLGQCTSEEIRSLERKRMYYIYCPPKVYTIVPTTQTIHPTYLHRSEMPMQTH